MRKAITGFIVTALLATGTAWALPAGGGGKGGKGKLCQTCDTSSKFRQSCKETVQGKEGTDDCKTYYFKYGITKCKADGDVCAGTKKPDSKGGGVVIQ
jgi:hypothetical protein